MCHFVTAIKHFEIELNGMVKENGERRERPRTRQTVSEQGSVSET